MRVIAGSAKGTRLAPVPPGVRPLSDRAREGLFSSVAKEVRGALVLDLYAGTGALGIEALSRGAEHATFVDRSRHSLAAVRQNLARTRLADRADLVRAEALAFLAGNDNREGPYRLAFLDPPHAVGASELDRVLAALAALLDPAGATVALTRGRESSTTVIPVHWPAARQLRYGDSLVVLYRPEKQPENPENPEN